MVLDKPGTMLMKKLLKSLAISLGLVTSLLFIVRMLGCLLLLDFNVMSCLIPFQINDVVF